MIRLPLLGGRLVRARRVGGRMVAHESGIGERVVRGRLGGPDRRGTRPAHDEQDRSEGPGSEQAEHDPHGQGLRGRSCRAGRLYAASTHWRPSSGSPSRSPCHPERRTATTTAGRPGTPPLSHELRGVHPRAMRSLRPAARPGPVRRFPRPDRSHEPRPFVRPERRRRDSPRRDGRPAGLAPPCVGDEGRERAHAPRPRRATRVAMRISDPARDRHHDRHAARRQARCGWRCSSAPRRASSSSLKTGRSSTVSDPGRLHGRPGGSAP